MFVMIFILIFWAVQFQSFFFFEKFFRQISTFYGTLPGTVMGERGPELQDRAK